MKQGNIALLGCGWWGKNIGRNLHALGALGAVVDDDPGRRDFARESFPGVRVSADPAEALRDAAVDAVCIATPAATHARLACEALAAGKDVFVEKPVALTLADGERVVREARERGRVLMVGHLLRYHAAVRRLKELLDGGALGELRYVYSNRLNLGKVRSEENILWSFAPHDIDTIIHLTGRMPARVLAVGGGWLQAGIADTTMTHLFFDGGLQAHIYVSWLHPFKDQRLVLVGAEAMALFDDVKKTEKLVLFSNKAQVEEGKPIAFTSAPQQAVPYEEGEPLRAELAHFADCVASRARPRTDGESALAVLSVLESCQESMAAGGRVVDVRRVPACGGR